ncbi:MAG TPA: pitrilysin family protein, partial [Longimicrobiales bacterium]|nr:pitrilysin family protein [Longimicrobiales bacterium]
MIRRPGPVALARATLCGLAVLPGAAGAQVPLEAPLPADPAVITGTLENGLRFYVRANRRPEDRAELRLVVDAGSVLEDDSQRGLAHLVEHMAFNGTEHFAKQELVDYLESIGMEFGPSVNAYTSFDETVFMLRVPTDDPEVLATGFQILEDWAHGLSFEPEEVDQERGVVVEEWRLGRGASARISDQQLPVVFEGSRYAERLPIGSVEVLETFPRDELVRFYRTWYRPDLMAVVAVGDFDPAAVEESIRTHFAGIAAPDAPVERPSYDVPGHEGTRFAIASDPEASGSQVSVLSLREPPVRRTVADYRQALVESLAGGMLNDRLGEITQRPGAPFALAVTGRGRLVRTRSAFRLTAVVPDTGHIRGLEALLTEAERAARHGFTGTELERQKLDLLRAREVTYNDRDNQPSARFASEYVSSFLTGAPATSIAFDYQAAQALVPGITVDEVNAVARADLEGTDQVVMVSGIDKEGVEIPDEAELRTVFESVAAADIGPYEDTAPDRPLVADLPDPGRIVGEETLD